MIGLNKCKGLIGCHIFSGADWGEELVAITKKFWANAYRKLDEDDPAINCFQKLGEGPIQTCLVNGHLPSDVDDFEGFVWHVYCSTGPQTTSTEMGTVSVIDSEGRNVPYHSS